MPGLISGFGIEKTMATSSIYEHQSYWGSSGDNTTMSNTLYTVANYAYPSYTTGTMLDTTVVAVYSSDGMGGGTVRKFAKRWITILSNNATNTAVAILSATSIFAYNSDATNFPAGTANAGRALWAVNSVDQSVELRIYGSTSPAATSIVNYQTSVTFLSF